MAENTSRFGRLALLAALTLFGFSGLCRPLNHDAAAVLAFAQRMLEGERLYADLIDVNPPLIFLLSILPAALARVTGWSAPLLLCSGVLALALGSVRLSLAVLAQGQLAGRPIVRALAAPALLIALLAMPMHSFAQREHLLAIFVLPYLFAAGQRIDGLPTPHRLAMAASAFAAVGLLLKPHFLAIALAVELGVLIARGPARGLRAPEPWTMAAVGLLYLAVMLVGFPAYLNEIVPLARALYERSDGGVFLWILAGDQVPPLMVVLLAGAIAARLTRDGALTALSLALAGAMIAGIAQGKGWDYHFLCARALAMVLGALTIARLIGNGPAPKGLALVGTALALVASGALSPAFKAQREFAASPTGRLAPLLKEHAFDQPVLWLTGAIYPQYPALLYNGSRSAMTYMSLWMLPSLYGAGAPVNAPAAMGAYERRLFEDVGVSLARVRPALVISADPDSEGGFSTPGFDYLTYFRRHPSFEAEWSRYKPIARVDRLTLFKRSAD